MDVEIRVVDGEKRDNVAQEEGQWSVKMLERSSTMRIPYQIDGTSRIPLARLQRMHIVFDHRGNVNSER